MALDKKAIETLSVNAVRDSIVMSDFLDQFIPDNDKEPFWDGGVYIYKSKQHTKENFKGRMPVQVKGKVCDDHSQDEISYQINTTDLRAYLTDGGAVYFVVYIGSKGLRKKIYYVELTPVRIRVILHAAKNQKSKAVKLKAFPTDGDKKATIFMNCLQHCKKQASFSDAHLFSLDELQSQGVLENITIPLSGIGIQKDPQMALISNDVYVYANIKGSSIPQPLEMLPQDIHTHEENDASITIEGKKFYDKIRIVKSAESTKYVLGESFSLTSTHDDVGIKMNYKNVDDVRVIAKDLDFMLSYIDAGYFEINGQKFPFEYDGADYSNFNIEQQKTILDFAKKSTEVLDILRCDKKLLMSSLGDEDCRNMYRLYSALVNKEPAKGLKQDLPFISFMKVGNLNFVIVLHKIEGEPGTYRIDDFFGANVVAAYDGKSGEKLPMSPYAILKADDLIKADNAKWELLLPSFKDVDKHEETFERANWFLLELLNAYDKCGNKNILNTAKEFAEWILTAADNEMPKVITTLNSMQVTKRMRELNADEQKILYEIVAEKETPNSAMVGAYLLLDQQALAEIYFGKMEPDEQEEFINYPIYHFWKKSEDENNG